MAQEINNLNIEEPSPQAYSISKIGETKVSLATGTPLITIPIITLKERDIEIPIYLKHHGDALKVNENASRVGLGWSLIAGGAVSRRINGTHDDLINIGVNELPSEVKNDLKEVMLRDQAVDFQYLTDKNYLLTKYKFGELDIASDEYFFSFLNYRGSFIKDIDEQPFFVGSDEIVDYDLIDGFISNFEDNKGFNYWFNDDERAYLNDLVYPWGYDYVSTRYLSYIEHPNGIDRIDFLYSTINNVTIPRLGRQNAYLRCDGFNYQLPESPLINFQTFKNYKRLDKIITPTTEVQFITDETVERKDIKDKSRLDKILIIDRDNNEIIKTVNFKYSYFKAIDDLGVVHENYKLKLKEVEFVDNIGATSQSFIINYVEGNIPTSDTRHIDHWGYYNYNDKGRIPIDVNGGFLSESGIDELSNKSVNENRIKIGTIKSIVHPSGGKVEYLFESNRDEMNRLCAGLRVSKIKYIEDVLGDIVTYEDKFEYLNKDGSSSGNLLAVPNYGYYLYANNIDMPDEPWIGGLYSPYYIYKKMFESNQALISHSGKQISYDRVCKIRQNGNSNNGKEIYYFMNHPDENTETNLFIESPSIPYTSFSEARGILIREEYVNKDDDIILSKDYNYEFNLRYSGFIPGTLWIESTSGGSIPSSDLEYTKTCSNNNFNYTPPLPYDYYDAFYITKYKKVNINSRLKSVVESNLKLSTKSEYEYPIESNLKWDLTKLPSAKIIYGSKENLKTEFEYDSNWNPTKIIQRNLMNQQINKLETNLYKNNKLIEKKVGAIGYSNNYVDVQNIPLITIYKSILDSYDNIIEIESRNNKTSYLYDYNKTKIIAIVENSKSNNCYHTSFEEGTSKIANPYTGEKVMYQYFTKSLQGLDNGKYILEYYLNNDTGWTKMAKEITVTNGTYDIAISHPSKYIDELRFYPVESQMTTYTYNQLAGITSITDPRGEVTYYEYDDFNRLKFIKDNEGNILKKIEYNYSSQN